MEPLWAETARELVSVHSPLLEYEVIEEEAPDAVISIMVERFLIRLPDDMVGRRSAEIVREKAMGGAPADSSNFDAMRTRSL